MVTTLVPIALIAGFSATAFFAFFAFWGALNRRATAKVHGLAEQLDRAGIRASPQEIVLTLAGAVAVVWITAVLLLHLGAVFAVITMPVVAGAAALGFFGYVRYMVRRRLAAFVAQLEPATRLIAGALRVGLGLRQALALVIEELPDPARYEFRRVVGQTNIGISVFDAIDDLAARMPSHETLMIARVFRVQSETGGDLASILDQLAATIKDRRQVDRKAAALTAEGKLSAAVLMIIPIVLGLFIATTQPYMAHALFYSFIGRMVVAAVAALELLSYLWLKLLLRIDA